MELEVTSISARSQDQKGPYVFVRMCSLDFYMHTHAQACMHAHTHAHTHICTNKEIHPQSYLGRKTSKMVFITREGDEQI